MKHSNEERRTPDASHIHNPGVSHETSDVNVPAIAKFIAGLFVGTVVFCLIAAGLFWYLAERERSIEPPMSPLAQRGVRLPDDAPRLQGAPTHSLNGENLELREPQAEMRVLREMWNQELNRSGVDPATGANRIPIEEAKRMVAQSGLIVRPPREGGDGQTPSYEQMPTYQSSGRLTERRTQ
jgi:hypothetical protein